MTFDFYPLRFEFTARDGIHFPSGKPGNVLRGAFGTIFRRIACVPSCHEARSCDLRSECAYARIFEPSAHSWSSPPPRPRGVGLPACPPRPPNSQTSENSHPSGLADWPRPFVFRARHLDGCTVRPGQPFYFDVNIFDLHDPAISYFVLTFSQIAREGLGPRRGRADLRAVWQLDTAGSPTKKIFDGDTFLLTDPPEPARLSLEPAAPVEHIRVDFLSPTELKTGQQLAARPEFPILFGRIRDRLSTLRSLYGEGPLPIDFKAMGERAATVQMTHCEIRGVEIQRVSGKTGQTHPLGGFIGRAEYAGELTEFLPYLRAAGWTGVGRQTVWGKGELRYSVNSDDLN